jgi:hypothetical protein
MSCFSILVLAQTKVAVGRDILFKKEAQDPLQQTSALPLGDCRDLPQTARK